MPNTSDNSVAHLVSMILANLGLDRTDPELRDTPFRFAELLRERFVPQERSPIRPLPSQVETSGAIVLRDTPYHALCAHHIVPFFGRVDIAYLPDAHIAGFGAFPRLVEELSKGPQLQERLVVQIASAIEEDLKPKGVLVRMQARQMCMELTGASGQTDTIVFAARGCYSDDVAQHAAHLFGPLG